MLVVYLDDAWPAGSHRNHCIAELTKTRDKPIVGHVKLVDVRNWPPAPLLRV